MTTVPEGDTSPVPPRRVRARSTALPTGLGAAGTGFVLLTLLVRLGATDAFDRALLDRVHARPGGWVAHAARTATTLGDTVPLLTVLVLAGVLVPLRWGGSWRPMVLPWVAAILGSTAAHLVKDGVGRERPPRSEWLAPAHGFAFPSGHATSASAGYLALVIVLAGLLPDPRSRYAVLVAGVALALLVGVSRAVLGVHWPTDVLGGWALGTAVAVGTVWAARGVPRYPAPSP